MKTLLLPFLIFASLFFAQGQTFENAHEYMAYMDKEYMQISEQTWDYTSAVARGKKAKKIEAERQELLKTIKLAEIRIKKLKDFEGDIEYRDKVLEYLNLSYIVLKEDYDKILDMEEIAEQSYDLMEAYLLAQDEADKKLEEAIQLVIDDQKRFATKNNIELLEESNETGKKLEEAGKVFDYYKKIYLVFFKSFKNDIYLSEAISRMDLNAIEQNMESAKMFVEEGNEKLKEYGSFNNDPALFNACQDLLDFYEKDTKENEVSDFILLQEKLQAKSDLMEKKKKSELTQDDVDDFNELVAQVNELSEKLNKYNQTIYKVKNGLIDNWNKTVDSFLNKHTPK